MCSRPLLAKKESILIGWPCGRCCRDRDLRAVGRRVWNNTDGSWKDRLWTYLWWKSDIGYVGGVAGSTLSLLRLWRPSGFFTMKIRVSNCRFRRPKYVLCGGDDVRHFRVLACGLPLCTGQAYWPATVTLQKLFVSEACEESGYGDDME